ncbi:MAG: SbcC/MukB-like Walker B domain-containing protein [Acinetobacter sp.]
MKILRLRLQNLASLAGEHDINFESAPLAHAGLIAITGKTGAGKSTLLDAMCLALFDQIPRLNGAVGTLQDPSGQGIAVKDSKNILRRGCVSGYAELEFLALDHKRYVARWDIRRARNKVDGNLKVERAVTCLEDGRVLTQKISECTPCIQHLIGLSFEQFTRAVLLAQSEVGAFLKAKDQDRADLLEYLTNSNIFSLVSKTAFEKTKDIRLQRERLNERLGHIDLRSEEEIQRLKDDLVQQQQLCETLQQQQKLAEQHVQWHQTAQTLQKQQLEKQQLLQQHILAEQQLQPQQLQLQQLEILNTIRSSVEQQQDIEQQIRRIEPNLVQQKQHFEQLEQQFLQQQQQFRNAEQQLAQENEFQQKIHADIEQAEQYVIERETLIHQYREAERKCQTLQQQQVPLQTTIQQQQQQLQKLEQQQQHILQQLVTCEDVQSFDAEPQSSIRQLQHIIQLKQRIEQLFPNLKHDDVAQLTNQVNQLQTEQQPLLAQFTNQQALQVHIQTNQQQREQLLQQLSIAEHCTSLLEHYQGHQQHITTLTQKNLLIQQQQQYAHEQLQQHHAQYQQQKTMREQLQHTLQQQRLIFSKDVEQLRANLKPNEACVVCGSHEHPFVQHQDLVEKSLLHVQEQQEQQALAQEQDCFEQWQKQQQHTQQLSSELQYLQQQLAQHQQQSQTLQQQLQEKSGTIGWSINFQQDIQAQLQQHHSKINQQKQKLEQKIAQQQQTLAHWQTLEKQLQTTEQQLELLQQWHSAHLPIVQALPKQLHQTWQQHTTDTAKQLIEKIQRRSQLIQQQKQVQEQQQLVQQQLQPLLHNQQHVQKMMDDLQQELQRIQKNGDMLKQRVLQLTRPHCPTPFDQAKLWLNTLKQQKLNAEQDFSKQKQLFDVSLQQYQQEQQNIQQLQGSLQHLQQQAEQCLKKVTQWQQQHPEFTTDVMLHLLKIDIATQQHMRQHLQQQAQAVQIAQANLNSIEAQLQQHSLQQPDLDLNALQQRLADLNTQQQRTSASRDELKLQLQLHQEKIVEQQKFANQIVQIQQEEYRWSRISDLIGSADGAKFKKIAQEHHLDILVEYANQQLQPLAPRYQLQRIPHSLGLAIIDQEMNSEIRPVLSLSGGETFLVSLALALAIANMASNAMKLESLFIDEGFGTLDPASLHMVMDALDRLQSQGRKVVLISHIQDMHERIPVQIQVKPLGSGASTVQVVG